MPEVNEHNIINCVARNTELLNRMQEVLLDLVRDNKTNKECIQGLCQEGMGQSKTIMQAMDLVKETNTEMKSLVDNLEKAYKYIDELEDKLNGR